MNIPLGYEIGTGKRVTIPVNHTVVLGQTQLSGKTTTLEAMVTRSGLRAVGFITKPGEKSFRLQTQIPAFFSESSSVDYWKYIVSIVENLMAVKLGWQERGWIMKLCQEYEHKVKEKEKSYKWKAPKTLRGLLVNVEIVLPHLRGTAEMICLQLREYLESVVREIGHTEFSSTLELEPGINVMDVTELSDGLKSLVIRSVIDHVHKRGRKIIVIIPEAWKFIPEGRSTPVKLALEGLIREGAGVGNFVWMDSQDLRGVDKLLLRSVIVWLFGVQRQKNEVASTLASIPDHPKPTATEIMQLGKGEFYVCYGQTLVRTYVQPAGMEDAHAQAIARGDESPDSWRQISKALDDETENREQEENSGMGSEGPPASDTRSEDQETGDRSGHPAAANVDGAAHESQGSDREALPAGEVRLDESRVTSHESPVTESEDEAVWKEKYEELKAEYDVLVQAHDGLALRVLKLENRSPSGASPMPLRADEDEGEGAAGESAAVPGAVTGAADARSALGTAAPGPLNGEYPPHMPSQYYDAIYEFVKRRASKDLDGLNRPAQYDLNFIYQEVKMRAAQDPGILELLTRRPELRVTNERGIVKMDGKTTVGGIALLIHRGFFDTVKSSKSIIKELRRLGYGFKDSSVAVRCGELATLGFLTKEDSGFQAVHGMKINVIEETGKAAAAR
jgi:hypothetical protein